MKTIYFKESNLALTWLKLKFVCITSLILVYEQSYLYSQIHRFNPFITAVYYAIDVPFIYIMAYSLIPFAARRPNRFFKLLLIIIVSFGCFIFAQNIADAILLSYKAGKLTLGPFAYKNSIWRAINLCIFSIIFFWWDESIRVTREKEQLERKNLELEAEYLRAKIKPHFIFNNLDFIHSLIEQNSPNASKALLQFSDCNHYIVESSNINVPLAKELKESKNYIELNALRLGSQQNLKVTFPAENAVEGLTISPLLLINILENMFIHGDLTRAAKPAEVIIGTEGNQLFVRTWNRKGHSRKLQGQGLGLSFVIHQLNIKYPNRHSVVINNTDDYYELLLSIEL